MGGSAGAMGTEANCDLFAGQTLFLILLSPLFTVSLCWSVRIFSYSFFLFEISLLVSRDAKKTAEIFLLKRC